MFTGAPLPAKAPGVRRAAGHWQTTKNSSSMSAPRNMRARGAQHDWRIASQWALSDRGVPDALAGPTRWCAGAGRRWLPRHGHDVHGLEDVRAGVAGPYPGMRATADPWRQRLARARRRWHNRASLQPRMQARRANWEGRQMQEPVYSDGSVLRLRESGGAQRCAGFLLAALLTVCAAPVVAQDPSQSAPPPVTGSVKAPTPS